MLVCTNPDFSRAGLRATTLLLLAASAVSPHAQPQPPANYARLVDTYRSGDMSVVRQVVEMAPTRWPDWPGTAGDAGRWTPEEWRAAALLHTDAGIVLLRERRAHDALAHFRRAAAAVDASLSSARGATWFARRWDAIAAGYLRAFGGPSIAEQFLSTSWPWREESEGEKRARAAYERGLASEIQGGSAGRISGRAQGYSGIMPPEAEPAMRAAAREYQAALALLPDFAEAALHLGRVRMLFGDNRSAALWLERAAARGSRVRIAYLAELFLGAIAERSGLHGEAERRYRAAIAHHEHGQSAYFALAHLLARTGRDTEAAALLADRLARTTPVVEPLRIYLALPDERLQASLDELRAEVQR